MVDTSMLDLFKMEVGQQSELLNKSLLALDQNPTAAEHLEAAMRASHSIKGASRLLGIESVQQITHVMEDYLVSAQAGELLLDSAAIDVLLKGMDTIKVIADGDGDLNLWLDANQQVFDELMAALGTIKSADSASPAVAQAVEPDQPPVAEALPEVEMSLSDSQDVSMLELFRIECELHGKVLADGLLQLEQNPTSADWLEQLMLASHSIKGAARMVDVDPVVQVAHAMEDSFVAAQNGELVLSADDIDVMLKGLDIINEVAACEDSLADWFAGRKQDVVQLVQELSAIKSKEATPSLVSTAGSVIPTVAATETFVEPDICLDIQDPSMLDLFRIECEQHGTVLNQGLLDLEQAPTSLDRLEPLMRAAHSVKGAARLVGIDLVVKLAHVMEDDFVAAQNGDIVLDADQIDVLLKGSDTITELAMYEGEHRDWYAVNKQNYLGLLKNIDGILKGEKPVATAVAEPAAEFVQKKVSTTPVDGAEKTEPAAPPKQELKKAATPQKDRVLRVSAELVNRLMGLAGESLVESRWLNPYSVSLQRLKRQQTDLVCVIDSLREHLERQALDEGVRNLVRDAQRQASQCREVLSDRLVELESYDRRSTNLSSRLHTEVVGSRMRPFGDGVHGFPRMVRDISRSLSKDVQLVIEGETTLVDRDILDKIEAPLNHIVRNAIDHGLETTEERAATDKPAKGTIHLSAHHSAGMLSVVVEDDGRGVDLERLRQKVVGKGLVDQSMADTLAEAELLEFLFLPSFSTKDNVSEISGRGVGLDVVHDAVQEMRGNVRVTSTLGAGTRFHMQLPLTLSVIPALLVEISGEPYAFPLARIDRIASVARVELSEAEGNQFVVLDGKNVGLVSAAQILEKEPGFEKSEQMSVVVLNDRQNYYGMVVDKFLGERELVVQVLPEALGKVQDISSAALMEDGSPLLIVDIDDLIRSIEKVLKVARLGKVGSIVDDNDVDSFTRILVVDDSITVREVERKLLVSAGYQVQTAVDGMDGLNMLRSQHFDMLVTDVDMPRMNGVELVKTLRQDASLRSLPVLMVSYKDREEDKMRGLEAGADYYLTKGSFHDEGLLNAVVDLIGEAKK